MLLAIAIASADPCAGVDPCKVVETLKTRGGEVLHVAYAADPPEDLQYHDVSGDCIRHAYVWKPEKGPERSIVTLCNDGYGASGVGSDDVSVEDGVFSHSQYGGSAWRWSQGRSLQLEPPRMLSESSMSMFMGMVGTDRTWSWKDFAGTYSENVDRCGSEEPETVEARLVPSLPAIEGWDWKKTGLGACAARIDAAIGPFAHGSSEGKAEDAGLSVARIGDDLYVEVRDDTWVKKAASWVKADHVELWLRPEALPYQECVTKHPAVQWGIGLDGTVYPAHGEPKPVKAEVVEVEGGVRLRISGLPKFDGLAVVYSDSDDGKTQERLIATSPVRFGHGETLAPTEAIAPDKAVCIVGEKGLVVKETRAFPADRPLLSGAD
ncbi:MAG: hypothetical protein H6737_23190 [Alphaproteobacteria bacterium]|nr:hypothetical protein [Alphaproteobacteria bacterium]